MDEIFVFIPVALVTNSISQLASANMAAARMIMVVGPDGR